MSRRSCRSVIATSGGDVDLRSHLVYAADVEGRLIGRVRSQHQLAVFEAEHGRLLLGSLPLSDHDPVISRLRSDGQSGWAFLLAGGDGVVWTTSRQANIRSVIDAAARCAARPLTGDAIRLSEDSLAVCPTESGTEVALPRPDRLRFGFALPARDPGPGWSDRFARLAAAARTQPPEPARWQAAGAVLGARAWHLAADQVRDDLAAFASRCGAWDPLQGPCPPPEQLLSRVDGLCAVWEVRQNALLDLGMDDEAAQLAESIADAEAVRERWLTIYARETRTLLSQLRSFGPGSASPLGPVPAEDLIAHQAITQALEVLPRDWVGELPPIQARQTPSTAGFAGLFQFDRATGCALVSVRADDQLGDPVAVAAHELAHGVQLSTTVGPRVRAVEEAFLTSLPVLSGDGGLEVRFPVPGDDYAGVWADRPVGLPGEMFPQLLAWLAFDPRRASGSTAQAEWSRRFWPGAPDALHLGLGLLGAA